MPFHQACSAAKAKKLIDGGYDGKTVVLGIRPEDVHDSDEWLKKSPETVIEVHHPKYTSCLVQKYSCTSM